MNNMITHFPHSAQLICFDTPPQDVLSYFAQMPFLPVTATRHFEAEALLSDLRECGCDALLMQVDEDGTRMMVLLDEVTDDVFYRRGDVSTPLMIAPTDINEPVSALDDRIAFLIDEGVSYSVEELMDAALGVAA
jgi:hypothetical protein